MFTGKWYKTWGQGVRNESSEGGYNREEEGMERQGENDEIMMSHHDHECSATATDHDISRYVTPAPDERGSNQGGWAHAHTRQVHKMLGINICMYIYIYDWRFQPPNTLLKQLRDLKLALQRAFMNSFHHQWIEWDNYSHQWIHVFPKISNAPKTQCSIPSVRPVIPWKTRWLIL